LDDQPLGEFPEGVAVFIKGTTDPEVWVVREGSTVSVQVHDTIRKAEWEHKYSPETYAEAMTRAVRRLSWEGMPYEDAGFDGSLYRPDCYVWWDILLDAGTPSKDVVQIATDAYIRVCERAERILEDSDSALVLGKDTGEHLERLRAIAKELEEIGYQVYLVRQEPDRPGETVIQKVLRHALSARFVVVENTDPSGHLYEFPHVAKMAECVVAVLQERGKGATWMFEDGYARHRHWCKFEYAPGQLKEAVIAAVQWAEEFVREFSKEQKDTLPWLHEKPKP